MPSLEEIIRHQGREYVLAASSLADNRTQILKSDSYFAVLDRYGDVLNLEHAAHGVFGGDTRHVSLFVMRIEGQRPLLLGSRVSKDNAALFVDLTNPTITDRTGNIVRQDTLHFERAHVLWDRCSHETISATNFAEQRIQISVDIDFASDFVDIFEIRGRTREARGQVLDPVVNSDSATIAYVGLDGQRRETRFRFHPTPEQLDGSKAVFLVDLEPKQSIALEILIDCSNKRSQTSWPGGYRDAAQASSQRAEAAFADECRIETSNERFNVWLDRSRADLQMLATHTEYGIFPYAGTPWFSAPFGRDSIITALQTMILNPRLARGVLGYLAAFQAEESDPARDAEPGKILHESRSGEMAKLGETPFAQYYGSVDATPLFVLLASAYHQATADDEFIQQLWPNIRRALNWLERYADLDDDGFVEYASRNNKGIQNQAWKDSNDSVFHADGSLAAGPIAAVEVQGYTFAAWQGAARMARQFNLEAEASEWERRSEYLKNRFHQEFWCDTIGAYGMALDGEKRLCRIRSSNAGHCLFTGIALPGPAGRVAAAMMEPDMNSGWGVRTIGQRERRYNPMSYHNGSVWPHDNSLIAAGMARYGHKKAALDLMSAMFQASEFFDLHRLPELFCGFSRTDGDSPTVYPVACLPQAWAAGSVFLFLQACLGLTIDATKDQVQFHRPILPPYLDEIVIRGLSVGRSRLDIRLQRYDSTVGINVLRRDGPAEVVVNT